MDNPNILQEITERLSNDTLKTLSHTPIWNSIKKFSEDQLWWFHRTEYLVGRSLALRNGNWKRAYQSLEKNGLSFDGKQDYGTSLVVSVLLEIGVDLVPHLPRILIEASRYQNLESFKLLLSDPRVDPSENDNEVLRYACLDGSIEAVKLLLLDPRVDPSVQDNYCIIVAVSSEHVELVRVLLADKRVDPSDEDDQAIRSAVENGDLEVTQMLLTDKRVDPSADNNTAIKMAIERGFTGIVRLLLSDQSEHSELRALANRIDPSDDNPVVKAVHNGHIEVVRLLLERRIDIHRDAYSSLIVDAVKFSSIRMIQLLISHVLDEVVVGIDNHALRAARRYKRRDVEKLLLSIDLVRETDEASRR